MILLPLPPGEIFCSRGHRAGLGGLHDDGMAADVSCDCSTTPRKARKARNTRNTRKGSFCFVCSRLSCFEILIDIPIWQLSGRVGHDKEALDDDSLALLVLTGPSGVTAHTSAAAGASDVTSGELVVSVLWKRVDLALITGPAREPQTRRDELSEPAAPASRAGRHIRVHVAARVSARRSTETRSSSRRK